MRPQGCLTTAYIICGERERGVLRAIVTGSPGEKIDKGGGQAVI